MSRGRFILVLAALGVLLSTSGLMACQAAEKFPSRTITISSDGSPGTPSDLRSRVVSKSMEKILGVAVAVENRATGAGVAAFTWAKGQPADGYSIVASNQDLAFNAVKRDAPIKVEDFDAIMTDARQPVVFVVKADSPWKTLEDLAAYGKANPGKLRMGGTKAGGLFNTTAWKFAKLAGFEFVWIPFAGGAEVVPAVLAGNIDAGTMTPTVPMPFVKEGKLRFLAVSSDKPEDYLPGVPTFKERGFDLVTYSLRIFFIKKGTPADRIKILRDAMDKAHQTEEWKRFLETSTEQEVNISGPDTMKLVTEVFEDAKAFDKEQEAAGAPKS